MVSKQYYYGLVKGFRVSSLYSISPSAKSSLNFVELPFPKRYKVTHPIRTSVPKLIVDSSREQIWNVIDGFSPFQDI